VNTPDIYYKISPKPLQINVWVVVQVCSITGLNKNQ